jgi:hypothetical protein
MLKDNNTYLEMLKSAQHLLVYDFHIFFYNSYGYVLFI